MISSEWKKAIVRNALILSLLAACFVAGVFTAEAVGTWLDHRDQAAESAEAPLLFK